MTHVYINSSAGKQRIIGFRSIKDNLLAITNDKKVVILPFNFDKLLNAGVYEGQVINLAGAKLLTKSRLDHDESLVKEWDKVYLIIIPQGNGIDEVESGFTKCRIYFNYLGNRASQDVIIPSKLYTQATTQDIIKYLYNTMTKTRTTLEYFLDKQKGLTDRKTLRLIYKTGNDFEGVMKKLFNFEASNRVRELN